MISVTDSETARFKYRGRISRAAAFTNKRVTSIQWCFDITAKIFCDYFAILGSVFAAISKLSWSMEARPIVRPDINPEIVKQSSVTNMSMYHS